MLEIQQKEKRKKKKFYVIEILESEHSVTLSHFFTVRIQKGLGSNSNSLIDRKSVV